MIITDPLTDTYNRRFLDEHFVTSLSCCADNSIPLDIVILDVDDFKKINDTYGHSAGDAVLKDVAAYWRLHFDSREKDRERLVIRYGGDEFIIAARGPSLDEFTGEVMEGLKSIFKKPDYIKGMVIYLILLGILNTFFTLIEPILKHLSGDKLNATQTGVVGMFILIMAIVGSFVLPLISDKDKQQRRKRYLTFSMVVGVLGLGLFIFVSSFTGDVVAAAVYGIFGLGCSPLVLTYCAEVAYPTSEGTSEGLLMFGGNVAGVIMLGIFGLLGSRYTLMMWIMVILLAVGTVMSLMLKEGDK